MVKSIYGNLYATLLWLRLLAWYLINQCNMKIIHAYSCIFYKKYDEGRLDLVVYNLFMEGRMETLENIKYMIKLKFNIQESRKTKDFLGVYYKWGHDTKGSYGKMTIDKDANKLVYGY